jgi:Tfp pilus assembly protein PilF
MDRLDDRRGRGDGCTALPRRTLLCALVLAGLAGCADTAQERMQQFNEDGVFLFRQGQYEAARQSFEAALRLKPEDAGLLYNLGQCHDRLGEAPKAEPLYKQCLEEAPNHAPCRHALAVLLLRQGRRSEADEMIEGWLAREPKLADAYVEDGWRLRQDGSLPEARGRLQQALQLDPHNTRALVEMGLLYEILERPSHALDLYERAIQQDPDQPEVRERVRLLRDRGVGKPLPD